MRKMIPGCIAALCLSVPITLFGQEGATPAFVYVTYFNCDAGREFRADEIIERSFKPHYDSAVEAGDILQWSWMSHFVGGQWRRALIIGASNMDDLLASAGALGEAVQDSTPEAGRVFTEVCPGHIDYIWRTVPGVGGTAVGTERGNAGFTTYWRCDVNREARADELMRETMAAVYNARIESGDLISWTWLVHDVGGEWRRVLSLTASDHNQMMRTRNLILEDLQSGRAQRALTQFNEICPDHEDMMWDIRLETP